MIIASIAITIISIAALLWPLLKQDKNISDDSVSNDIFIYRQQLAEIENDIARGLLNDEQAETVRVEIQRRILEAGARAVKHNSSAKLLRRILMALIVVIMPVAAALVYFDVGSPAMPGQPYAERANSREFMLAKAAIKLKTMLEKHPDAEGYKQLAIILGMMRQYQPAADAYAKAIELGGNDAEIWGGMGETLVTLNDGVVTAEALSDFNKASKADKADARSRFYIGLAAAQLNDFKKAVAIWKELAASAPADAPWLPMVQQNIEEYSKKGGF